MFGPKAPPPSEIAIRSLAPLAKTKDIEAKVAEANRRWYAKRPRTIATTQGGIMGGSTQGQTLGG